MRNGSLVQRVRCPMYLRPPPRPGGWIERSAILLLGMIALVAAPSVARAQAPWPFSQEKSQEHLQWFIGTYLPASPLGSFGHYSVAMDPWITIGVSARGGSAKARFRPRFEMAITPDAIMRRSSTDCSDCTAASRRVSVVHWRFLMDLTLPSLWGARTYLTAGPMMRIQLSRAKPCPSSDGEECALSEFDRRRVDPGLMAGAGWEPGWSWLSAVQLSGRLVSYGRETRPGASPARWLEAVELSVRFPLGR